MAIIADAAHMGSDAAGFAISLFAAWAVTWRGHSAYSFGFHRAEIIGALLSTLMIWGVTGVIKGILGVFIGILGVIKEYLV